MKEEYIDPFLESASIVIEQVVNVRPTSGELSVMDVLLVEDHIWIQIGLSGQMSGEVVFGLHKEVALRMVSEMMGGFEVTELDEMSQSAISELGNMISGNASTMLYNKGVMVDITPPKIVQSIADSNISVKQAMTIPLTMGEIGALDIQVMVS